MQFEWDTKKEAANRVKHGISFEEAATIFGDSFELTISDPDHSIGEFRFISIGKSEIGNLLVVSYTEREPSSIRIISARHATKKERKYYEQSQ